MDFLIQELNQDVEFEKRIIRICKFNNAVYTFRQGRILTIRRTNISFIEPHKIDINIKDKKLLLIYFDNNNLFLYNRTMPINIKQLNDLLKEVNHGGLV